MSVKDSAKKVFTKKNVCIGGSILLGIGGIILGLLQGQVEDETMSQKVTEEVAKQLSDRSSADVVGE